MADDRIEHLFTPKLNQELELTPLGEELPDPQRGPQLPPGTPSGGQPAEPSPTEITPPGQPDIYTAQQPAPNPDKSFADDVLRFSTGMGLKEWHQRIVSGELGEKV